MFRFTHLVLALIPLAVVTVLAASIYRNWLGTSFAVRALLVIALLFVAARSIFEFSVTESIEIDAKFVVCAVTRR